MGLKIATNAMPLNQSAIVTQSPSSYSSWQTPPSSLSSRSRNRSASEQTLVCQYIQSEDGSRLFGTISSSSRPYKARSSDSLKIHFQRYTKALGASFDGPTSDESAKHSEQFALKHQFYGAADHDEDNKETKDSESEFVADNKQGEDPDEFNDELLKRHSEFQNKRQFSTIIDHIESRWIEIYKDRLVWPDESIVSSIFRKANSVDLPLSHRIIKRKKQMEVDFREAGDSAYCSIKKAFSSMVSIIRELQIYTMHMRESIYFEDLHVIVARVERDTHASFVWIFQKVFSHTPLLMVTVMILLANFIVHSMSTHVAVGFSLSTETCPVTFMTQAKEQSPENFHSSIKTFTISQSSSPSTGKLASVGERNEDSGKSPPAASRSDRGEGISGSEDKNNWGMFPDGTSHVPSLSREDLVEEDGSNLRNSMGEETWERNLHSLDHETLKEFVPPIFANIDSDDINPDYFKTNLLYQSALARDRNNPLLLANFAQLLSTVFHDYCRAEEYFKRAVEAQPRDAEALSKYANFLWRVKKDLWAAEETYLEAISVDPTNSFYAANYAHFLWNTGGEDTCYPLDS